MGSSLSEPMLSQAESEFVALQRVARLATVDAAGTPHVVPVCPVLDGDRVVIESGARSAKVRNIRDNAKVSVAFDEYTENWSALRQVIVFGSARLIETGPAFASNRDLLYEKFPQFEAELPIEEKESVIIEVEIDRAASSGFDQG